LDRRDLEIIRLKLQLGMMSENQYVLATIGHERLLHDRIALENALLEAHRELNRLMGASVEIIHNLIYDWEFEELPATTNLRGHINFSVDNSPSVVQARRQMEAARFELDNHRPQVDMITGSIIPTGTTRAEREVHYSQASRDVRQARENMENTVIDLYHQIRDTELRLEGLKLQLLTATVNYELNETLYSVGQITRHDLNWLRHNVIALEEQVRRLEVQHTLWVMQFENPNIAVRF